MNKAEQILKYLRDSSEAGDTEINLNTELIKSGIIDSFSITSLVLYLEELFKIEIDINEITLRALSSVRAMVDHFEGEIQ